MRWSSCEQPPAADASSVQIVASQATIVLAGTVPSQEVADAMQARAVAIYSADQIDNQLIVDEPSNPRSRSAFRDR